MKKTIDYYGDSEFLLEINGRESYDVWEIIDELMTTLQAINPRLYTAVIQKNQRNMRGGIFPASFFKKTIDKRTIICYNAHEQKKRRYIYVQM